MLRVEECGFYDLEGGAERSAAGGKKGRAFPDRLRMGLISQLVVRPHKASIDGFEWWLGGCTFIAQNAFLSWFEKFNSPTKSSTYF